MNVSDAGLKFAQAWEKLSLTPYQDSGGMLTIGWGHTGPAARQGKTISEPLARELFRQDAAKAAAEVSKNVQVKLTQNQFDAVWDGEFNAHWLTLPGDKPSTLRNLLNAGDMVGACAEMAAWHHDNGKRVGGLLDRCIDRMRMFRGTPSRL